uniref:Uncharacterized protein n=1 Tax=Arundo donax TaxID=35708 RepID=A0A0A9BUV6_ARUDO
MYAALPGGGHPPGSARPRASAHRRTGAENRWWNFSDGVVRATLPPRPATPAKSSSRTGNRALRGGEIIGEAAACDLANRGSDEAP